MDVQGEATRTEDDPSLVAEAQRLAGEQAGAQPGAESAQAVNWEDESAQLVEWAYAMFAPLFPSIEPIYTAPRRRALAVASAPLMEKYHLSLAEFFKRWGPELACAMAWAPLIVPTARAVQADCERMRAEREAAKGAKSSSSKPADAPPGPTDAAPPNPDAPGAPPAAQFRL